MTKTKTKVKNAADYQAILTPELKSYVLKHMAYYIRGWSLSSFEREIILEYVWDHVIKVYKQYRPDGGATFRNWVTYTVAERAAISKSRSLVNDPQHEDSFEYEGSGEIDYKARDRAKTPVKPDKDFTDQLYWKDMFKELEHIVDNYIGRDRTVAEMLIAQKSKSEIMAVTQMNGGNVDTRICRVRKKMLSDLLKAGYSLEP